MSYLEIQRNRSRSRSRSRPHSKPNQDFDHRAQVLNVPMAPARPGTALATTTVKVPSAAQHFHQQLTNCINLPNPSKNAGNDPTIINSSNDTAPPYRPKTSMGYNSNLFGLNQDDRNKSNTSSSNSSATYKKNEILGIGINACCPEWSLYRTSPLDQYNSHKPNNTTNNSSNNATKHPTRLINWSSSSSDDAKNCDLEFINKGFKYIEEDSSVNELNIQLKSEDSSLTTNTPDGDVNGKLQSENGDGDDEDSPKKTGTLTNFMSSVLSMPFLNQKIFGEHGISSVGLLSGAVKMGEQLYRAGVGVASSLFSDQDVVRDDHITYNGYKIHTMGNNLCISSLIFRGPAKHQKLRIVIQTKEYYNLCRAEAGHQPSSNGVHEPKYEPKIFINEGKWTFIYGSYEEEGTGLVEIEVPPGLSLADIKTEGPCKGLVFIDIP